jgi:hypothetical protein
MLAYNLTRAVITTNYMQELYLDFPSLSGTPTTPSSAAFYITEYHFRPCTATHARVTAAAGFSSRCMRELGYSVGHLSPHADVGCSNVLRLRCMPL